jgi:uncharacterized Fe-S radical SAM superfamily protein PflX
MTMSNGQAEKNNHKNRYSDILPCALTIFSLYFSFFCIFCVNSEIDAYLLN